MPKRITYLLGAGASANALPTIKWMYIRMKYFHLVVKAVHGKIGDNGQRYDMRLDEVYDKFIKDVELFGTPDIVIRTLDIRESLIESIQYRTFLSAYIHFEQIQNTDDPYNRAISEEEMEQLWMDLVKKEGIKTEKYHSKILDPRYVSFLSTLIDPDASNRKISKNIKILTWNYDHQIELALHTFDPRKLVDIQRYHKVAPYTYTDDSDWTKELCEQKYSNSSIIKLNGTAGFVPNKSWSGIKILSESLTTENWRKLLDLLYNMDDQGVKAQKLMFAWDVGYSVFSYCRDQAKEILKNTEILVCIGYSFPDFNRRIDKEIFSEFKGTMIIQNPDAEKVKQKIKGVNPDIERIETVTETESFFIPYEFWED